MPTLIKSGAIVTDSYQVAEPVEGVLTLPAGDVLVSLETLLAHREQVLGHDGRKGVQIKPDQFAEAIADIAHQLDLVAVEFPAFADGRGYSTAYLLRTRYGYKGELRAVGDVDLARAGNFRGCIGNCADARTGDKQMDFAELRSGGDHRERGVLDGLAVMFDPNERFHECTPIALSLATSSSTSATLTPAERTGGSLTLTVLTRGAVSTP